MRLLAVSSPVDIEIDGRKPPTIKDEGIDLELTNWRAITGPPGLSDGERERIAGWVTRVLKTPRVAEERRALRLDAVRQDRRASSTTSSRPSRSACSRSSRTWASAK